MARCHCDLFVISAHELPHGIPVASPGGGRAGRVGKVATGAGTCVQIVRGRMRAHRELWYRSDGEPVSGCVHHHRAGWRHLGPGPLQRRGHPLAATAASARGTGRGHTHRHQLGHQPGVHHGCGAGRGRRLLPAPEQGSHRLDAGGRGRDPVRRGQGDRGRLLPEPLRPHRPGRSTGSRAVRDRLRVRHPERQRQQRQPRRPGRLPAQLPRGQQQHGAGHAGHRVRPIREHRPHQRATGSAPAPW